MNRSYVRANALGSNNGLRQQADWVALVEPFIDLPYEGNEEQWDQFMRDVINLPNAYRAGVKKAIANGKWRGKFEPIAWIRKVGQSAALNFIDLPDEPPRDRHLVHVGRACDPKQRHPTREDSLRFDAPKWRISRVDAGPISRLKVPMGVHDSRADDTQTAQERFLERMEFRAAGYRPRPGGCVSQAEEFSVTLMEKVPIKYVTATAGVNWKAVGRDAGLTNAAIDTLIARSLGRRRMSCCKWTVAISRMAGRT
jgi:hypothetical protein